LVALAACSTSKEDQPSYCEAVCDWAVQCAAAERTVDETALRDQCLESTRAADASCADAENKDLNPAESTALSECTDAVDSAASSGDCGAFTGSLDEIKAGTAPAECIASEGDAAQDTFDAAQDTTAETNDELCERLSDSFCTQIESCVLGALGIDTTSEISQDLIDAAGGTPHDACMVAVDSQTQSCKSDSLYEPEAGTTDVNTARQGARECLADFVSLSCDDLFAGNLPATCAGAFSSKDDVTAFASALVDVAGVFVSND